MVLSEGDLLLLPQMENILWLFLVRQGGERERDVRVACYFPAYVEGSKGGIKMQGLEELWNAVL